MKKSFVLYLDQYEPIKDLTDSQKGQLLDAMFKYHNNIDLNNIDPLVKLAFSFFKQTFERDNAKYLKTCEKNRENARMRWDAKNASACDRMPSDAKNADSDSDKIVIVTEDSDKKEKKIATFKKPTIEEIKNYCLERKNNIDPESFFHFYESKDWKIGKNKMKNWKSAMITWEKKNKPAQEEKPMYATLNR